VLNNTKVKQLKPSESVYRMLDSDGLYVEIKPNGRKFWRHRFRKLDGGYTMTSLGEFPSVTIEAARKLRDASTVAAQYHKNSFEQVARDWIAYKNYVSDKNRDLVWRRIEARLLPNLGKKNIAEIKPQDVLPMLKQIEKEGHLELARRVQNIAAQIFKYAVQNLMCETNPAAVLLGATKMPTIKSMPAIINEPGFRWLLNTIWSAEHLSPNIHYALKIAPYVFLRSESLRLARIEDIDFNEKVWLIPKDKMQRQHLIPLPDPLVALLKEAVEYSYDGLIFPGMRKGRPLSENTLNQALRSLGVDKDRHVFHGFRSSFSTLSRERLRIDSDLIELQLGHIEKNKVRAAYDRSLRIDERRELMQTWVEYIDGLRNQTP